MNLDDAIKHCEEVAEIKEKQIKNGDWEKDSLTKRNCIKCAEEHRQLAEWLKDYKRLKEQEPCEDAISRQAVLDTISELNAISFYEAQEDSKECYYELRQAIKDLSPVKPQEPKTEKVIKMRDATPEEQEAIAKYIKSISKPTGVEFDIDIDKKVESYGKLLKHPVIKSIMGMDETQEQLDFIQPHKRIPVTLTVSGDLISRQAVLDKFQWHSGDESNKYLTLWRFVENMPSVKLQPCEDAISKKVVLDMLEDINAETEGVGFYYEHYVDYIKSLPSIKPQEPQTGRWIKTIGENGITSAVRCSECGFEDNRYMLFRYCPDCGAKMEVEQNG